ncbi:zinc-dependent alcohol dehydrogenase [Aureimonas pseudogalii]|uniref:L-iditol 2-dehydrogenase n=1 Tax=Aureimonas pseudogalii TaxID=1744844 RepID=A0A7W6H850_9HYPH|nr:alcohol dehydrogenase catalytic domain-containing protein [Aureimonas pseudogalii]MBB4000178.1 L-iditol 2-dehydrogenase [Aureimonas pseudogalii]
MKALVYLGKRHLELRDVDEPRAEPGSSIVRVAACGICGSDLHGYHGDDPRRVPPLVMGHEIAGVVETGPLAGARVAVNPLVTCGTCDACLSGRPQLCEEQGVIGLPPHRGGFARKVRVPDGSLVPIPDGLDFAAACLAEPVAVAYHAVRIGTRLSHRPLSALAVAVLGGGAIGLATALIAALQGAGVVHLGEVHAGRRDTARAANAAIRAYDPGGPDGPAPGSIDLVFDAVGARATREAAFRMVRRGGAIVHMGLMPGSEGVDMRRLTLAEIAFAGSYCYSMPDFRETVALLASNRLGPLNWIEERPLEDGAAAFEDIDRGRFAKAKLILKNPDAVA